MIYFDNAATSGHKPREVTAAVEHALRNLSANPGRGGHEPSIRAATAVYNARAKLAELFGASSPENVAFTMNCTHSINCVLKGILKPGDHIVISSMEHNAVMRPLSKMGINYSTAEVSLTDDDATLEEFRKKIRVNTKLVLCMGASNVTGKILPIKQIGRLCRERGKLFAVDAAQTAGVLPINMKEDFIDYLCIAPHKGLYAPMGLGVLICEKPIFNTLIEGGTGTSSLDFNQPDAMPERLESGTVNVPAIAGASAGVDFIKRMGIGKIYNHEIGLCKGLYDGLKANPNIILYTPDPVKFNFAPVISFNVKGAASADVAQALADNGIAVRGGFHCAPTAHKQLGTLEVGTVRASVSVFNTQNEVNTFLNILKQEKFMRKILK